MANFGSVFSTRDELFTPPATSHASAETWRKITNDKENPLWDGVPLAKSRPTFGDDNEDEEDDLPKFKLKSLADGEPMSLFPWPKRDNSGSAGSASALGGRVGNRSLSTLSRSGDGDVSPPSDLSNFFRSSAASCYRDAFHDVAPQDSKYSASAIGHLRDLNTDNADADDATTELQSYLAPEIQSTPLVQTMSSTRDAQSTHVTPAIRPPSMQPDRTAPSTLRYPRLKRLPNLGPPKRSRLSDGIGSADGEDPNIGEDSPRLERCDSDGRSMLTEDDVVKKDAPDWGIDNVTKKTTYTTAPSRVAVAFADPAGPTVTPLPQGPRKDRDVDRLASRDAIVSSASSSSSSASSSPIESPGTSPENSSTAKLPVQQVQEEPPSQPRVSRIDFGGQQSSLSLLNRFQEPKQESAAATVKSTTKYPTTSQRQERERASILIPIVVGELTGRESPCRNQKGELITKQRFCSVNKDVDVPRSFILFIGRSSGAVEAGVVGINATRAELVEADTRICQQHAATTRARGQAAAATCEHATTAARRGSIGNGIGSGRGRGIGNSSRIMVVNNRQFTRLDTIGRGGSSKVYKVMTTNHHIYALKKVMFDKADQSAISGYINEINLLKRMAGHERIIKMYDSEVNYEKSYLMMLMECGEIDLAHVLTKQQGKPINLNFIRLYWEQMLQAVDAIHQEKIVHSDLKPANFLFVEGSLKLIDFGIAKAISNDTTNIHRDQQIGTVNYMSPEAILDTNGNQPGGRRCMKVRIHLLVNAFCHICLATFTSTYLRLPNK
ncbi:hypothetical protein BC938DRAFT_477831 [Jimgerdemannia flammicorona]|uniref:Protein kinase domain-containing protein n=1 Tax=Jimgerdemannia flammicorona TaxID=994334 RepID=A0A433QYR2_9FUNG|nr:hypothetical protein BC938DRAFT_477831 [Jimgerdemannia flammicorona]